MVVDAIKIEATDTKAFAFESVDPRQSSSDFVAKAPSQLLGAAEDDGRMKKVAAAATGMADSELEHELFRKKKKKKRRKRKNQCVTFDRLSLYKRDALFLYALASLGLQPVSTIFVYPFVSQLESENKDVRLISIYQDIMWKFYSHVKFSEHKY